MEISVAPTTSQRRVADRPFSMLDGSAIKREMMGLAGGCFGAAGVGAGGGAAAMGIGAFFLQPAANKPSESPAEKTMRVTLRLLISMYLYVPRLKQLRGKCIRHV